MSYDKGTEGRALGLNGTIRDKDITLREHMTNKGERDHKDKQ